MREMTRNDAAIILRSQIFSSARKVDVPLVDECLMCLDKDYSEAEIPNEAVVWTRISARIQEKNRHGAPVRRAVVIALVAALILALLGVAYAVFARNIFNFYYDAGWPKAKGTVQESAYQLLNSDLVHISLADTDIDVLEAVYDGHELRVVYSLWWRNATQTYPAIEVTKSIKGRKLTEIDTSCFTMNGIARECDWMVVNGADVYFSDTWKAMGDKPGQVLFYLQANLFDYDLDISDTLTIGLPLFKVPFTRDDGTQTMAHLPTAETTFTIPVTRKERLTYTLSTMEPQIIGGFPMRVSAGYFSPVNGFMQVDIIDINNEMDPDNYDEIYAVSQFAADWWERGVLCDMDFIPIGVMQRESWGQVQEEAGLPKCIATFSITPPVAWPKQMQFVLMDENGAPVKDRALVFSVMPDSEQLSAR